MSKTKDLLELDTSRSCGDCYQKDQQYMEYLEEKVKITEKAKELSSFIVNENMRIAWEQGFVEGFFYSK